MSRKEQKVTPMEPVTKRGQRRTTEVNEYVKDLPGLGGRKAEAEWQELFPALREVKKLFTLGNIPQAIRQLKDLRTRHPEVADIPAILGHAYMEQGRWDHAEEMFKEALARNPNHAESLSNLAYIYATRGINLPKAIELSRKAISLEGLRPEFHHTLGWALFKTGEVRQAIGALERALALKPDYLLARYNLGLAWYLTGSYEQALEAFNAVQAAQPGHAKARLFKAIAQVRLGQVEPALSTLDELRQSLPKEEVLIRVVEDLHARIKFAHERHTDLPVPKIKNPAPLEKLLAEARAYRSKGLVTHAKEKYLECQRLVPEDFRSAYELGDMYAHAGLNRPALAAWKQVLAMKPDFYPLQLNLGKVHLKLKHREEARAAFVKAQSLRQDDPEPHYYLGLMAYEEGRFEAAEGHALGAIRTRPRFFKAMALAGMARIRLGRLKPARDIYETLYAQAPAEASIKRHARKKIWELTRLMAPRAAAIGGKRDAREGRHGAADHEGPESGQLHAQTRGCGSL
jgi:tetratricopeptide (TPR) repeat protein